MLGPSPSLTPGEARGFLDPRPPAQYPRGRVARPRRSCYLEHAYLELADLNMPEPIDNRLIYDILKDVQTRSPVSMCNAVTLGAQAVQDMHIASATISSNPLVLVDCSSE